MTLASIDITGLKSNADALIFDFDGTLADSLWVWDDVDKRFLMKHNIAYDKEYAETITVLGFESGADYTIKKFNLDLSAEEIIEEWKALSKDAYANNVHLKPYAKTYLEKLSNAGIHMAIATSLQRQILEPCLKLNGVFHLFDSISVCDEITDNGKSTPAVYEHAAQALGVELNKCIVFEDVVPAALSAKRGGAYVVGVYDEHKHQATQELREISDEFIENYEQLL